MHVVPIFSPLVRKGVSACVCVSVCERAFERLYVCVCVCVCVFDAGISGSYDVKREET